MIYLSAIGVLASIPMDKVVVSDLNVRKTELERDIDRLAESIRRHGLLQPVVVTEKNGNYDLIVGQRRYLAIKRLGWKEIPALVVGNLDSTKSTIISISENIHRKEIPYRDMVDACDKLYERYHNVNVIAEELGVVPQTVQQYLAHRLVPEPVKKMVEEKRLSRQAALEVTNATMADIAHGNTEKTVKLAEAIADMPKPQQRQVLDVAASRPSNSPEVILEVAKRAPKRLRITLDLPAKYKAKLDEAAKNLEMDVEEVARTAVIQWLDASGYGSNENEEE